MEIKPLTAQIDVVVDNEPLYAKIIELKNQIKELESEKTQLQNQILTLEGDITELENKIISLDKQIINLNAQITTLESEKTALQTQITDLQSQITTLENQKTELETQIQTLETQISDLQTQISDLQSQISTLQGNLDLINGEIVDDKTGYLLETKNAIKEAIANKSVDIDTSTTFREYATKISEIPQGMVGDTHTLLLAHFDEETYKDDSIYNRQFVQNGTPTLSTSNKKFGNSSLYLNGSSNIFIQDRGFPNMTGYNCTIEFWLYLKSLPTSSSYQQIISKFAYGYSYGFYMYVNTSGVVFMTSGYGCQGSLYIPYADLKANTWQHIAFTKSKNTGRIFLDGVLKATTTFSTSYNILGLTYVDQDFVIGSKYYNGTNFFTGYIDELRISDICRYTEDFTPPTEPFTA